MFTVIPHTETDTKSEQGRQKLSERDSDIERQIQTQEDIERDKGIK